MGNRTYHILALVVILASSCSKLKEDCTEKGEYTRLVRQVSPFNTLQAEDRLDVELIQDPLRVGEIELVGYGNLFDGIRCIVENGNLYLRDENRCKWLRELDTRVLCRVYIDSLKHITNKDDAMIFSSDTLSFNELVLTEKSTSNVNLLLKTGTLTVEHWDAGEVILNGKGAIFIGTIYETGKLNAKNFTTENAYIFHYGLNSVSVKPRFVLECTIENSGSVYYHLNPLNAPDVKGRGSGNVVPAF